MPDADLGKLFLHNSFYHHAYIMPACSCINFFLIHFKWTLIKHSILVVIRFSMWNHLSSIFFPTVSFSSLVFLLSHFASLFFISPPPPAAHYLFYSLWLSLYPFLSLFSLFSKGLCLSSLMFFLSFNLMMILHTHMSTCVDVYRCSFVCIRAYVCA